MRTVEEPLSSEEPREANERRRRRLAVTAGLVVALLVATFLPPLVNLNKYRHRITTKISEVLGRRVYAGGMTLRLLPTPGFVLSDFTVAEDPAFGYEPALHAGSVVVGLRLSSLWRGRLEVSRISLDEANLNLVKNGAGQWSIASVLLRAAEIPNAPTAERHAGTYARFPYIEASDSRIDVKDGQVKEPFSLMNAEFSMWQASSGEWQLRLEAQPVRTDLELHLSDTGTLRVTGSLRRATDLPAMPVHLRAEWSGAQLGQVSRMVAGFDSGWRGDLDTTATIGGTAGDLILRTRVQIAHLRRQEFEPATSVNVDATCRSEYRHAERQMTGLTCFWPIGGGHLLLTGRAQGMAPVESSLQLEMNQIPASFAVTALGLMRPHAQAVTATGVVNGKFELVTGAQRRLTGDATATGVTLSYPGGTLTLPALHLTAAGSPVKPRRRRQGVAASNRPNAIVLQPVTVGMGEPEPLVVDGRVSAEGFLLHLTGGAALDRLMAAGGNFGLLENALAAAGSRGRAVVNTTTTGPWMPPLAGGTGIGTAGTVQVSGVELRPPFLRAPVQVESASINLTPEEVAWENVKLRYQGMALQGSMQFPAQCNEPTPCAAKFTLRQGDVSGSGVAAALTGTRKTGFLGDLVADALGRKSVTPWPPLEGRVQCNSLDLGRLVLRKAVASLNVEGGKMTLNSLDAAVFGGTLHAHGTMTMQNRGPLWQLEARVTGAKASAVAALFHDTWGGGVMSGNTSLTMSGYHQAELTASAKGSFALTWQNGGLASPFDLWRATGTVGNGALTVTGGGVMLQGRMNPVRGTIGFDRHLDLKVEMIQGPMKVRGTLSEPDVQ